MVRTARILLGALVFGGSALALTGCSDEEPSQEPSACVVVGCDCASDLDCDPALTCNTLIGLCSVRSGSSDDTGTDEDTGAGADSGADSGGDDGGNTDAELDVAPVDDATIIDTTNAFSRACDDACLTFQRCNDGADSCVEFCDAFAIIIDGLLEDGRGSECEPFWDRAGACIAGESQSCASVDDIFSGGDELCTDIVQERPGCFGFDSIDDGSGDEAPDGSGDGA